jgi:OOP family OmpA-OmpF porin
MTLNSRITERATNAKIVLVFFLAIGIYSFSAKAQGTQPGQTTAHDVVIPASEVSPVVAVSSTGENINLLPNLNTKVKSEAMKTVVNSAFSELKPTLAPDGSRLYFSRSNHPQNTMGEKDVEDIWYSNFSAISETWSDPLRMTGSINNDGPNFINNISTSGDTLFLGNRYGKNGKMRAGISYTINVSGKWSAPVNINIENDYNISAHANAFVSVKAGVIIQAVHRAETFGDRDLYISFWDGKHASEPVNLGSVINTTGEESSPFLAADNKTLYFASKGHAGFGGFDVFVTTRLDETWANWSEPRNLGTAVNGPLNDEFFSVTNCGKYATFTRQINDKNSDLFKISINELFMHPVKKNEKPVQKEATSFATL